MQSVVTEATSIPRKSKSATLHHCKPQLIAAISGVSLRTQKMADAVAKADPELAKRVRVSFLATTIPVALVDGRYAIVGAHDRALRVRDALECDRRATESHGGYVLCGLFSDQFEL